MRSHYYQFTAHEVLRAILPTALILAALSLGLKSAHRLGWLPEPPAAADPDRAVLAHQARACRGGAAAEVVLTGDSTCLVGVDAPQLSEALAQPLHGRGNHSVHNTPPTGQEQSSSGREFKAVRAVNLALYIWLDLQDYGELVSHFAEAHPSEVRAVVLLVCPAKLLAVEKGNTEHREFWKRIQNGTRGDSEQFDDGGSLSRRFHAADLAGSRALREHVLSHALATPLHGSGAAQFGFAGEIETYMTRHQGSVLTFGTSVLPRRKSGMEPAGPAWSLTPAMDADSRAFRAKMPPGAKLYIGLTPGMAGAASASERALRLGLLQQWNAAVRADAVLTNLPPVLPDVFFSSGGHLNATGQRIFTRMLARELAPLLK